MSHRRLGFVAKLGALGDLGHIQALNTAQGARAVLENGQPGESGDGRLSLWPGRYTTV